ncbi:hypothetical protein [Streptococcus salivarius]|uniref:hypothetical protein n=1 Tax=Streptococcus salivarius TaxID=1304 RepID=UPI0039C030CC
MNKQNRANIPVRDNENLNQIVSAASLIVEKRSVRKKQATPISTEKSNHFNEVQVLI